MDGNDRIVGAFAHDVFDCEEQSPAELATGMKAGEVLLRETFYLHECDSDRVADCKCGGSAGRGSKIEGTGFAVDFQVEDDIGEGGHGRLRVGGEGSDVGPFFFEAPKERDQFTCLAAFPKGENDVVFSDDADI